MLQLFTDPTFSTIFWGLVVVAVAAIGRFFRSRLLIFSRSAAKKLPESVQAVVLRSADRRYPSWRAKAGESRSQRSLEWRINKVREAKQQNYHILGAVYLDVFVKPVTTKLLDDREYSNLEQVRDDSGGSACYVGRFLKSNFGKRSFLYTRLGDKGPLSELLKKHLSEERWIRGRIIASEDKDAQCGVSIHLFQPNDTHHTTFTCKGALASLDWNRVLPSLAKKGRRGGILHISGYFRTGLYSELAWSLNQLPVNLITCIDHGKFEPDDTRNAANALLRAFSESAIDIYVCTFPELRSLMGQAGVTVDDSSAGTALKLFAEGSLLPRITVVRCEPVHQLVTAWVLVDKEVHPVERTALPVRANTQLGASNSFNAALIYYLSTGNPGEDFTSTITNAVGNALDEWNSNQ